MSRGHLLKTTGFNQLAEGRDGYCLYNKNDVYIGGGIQKYGEYSGVELENLRQLCSPGDVIIEVGANIGTHTVPLAKLVGNTGRVLAFEPQRLVFQTLCANVALNSLENVDCYWAAIGSEDGVVTVPEPDPNQRSNFGGVTLLNVQGGQTVDCFTLDRFVWLPRVKLLKVDVEGMEARVLAGGVDLIEKFKPFLYVENDRIETSQALLQLIDRLGYRMFWHMPPLFNPNNYYAVTENMYPNLVSFNLLCAHREVDFKVQGIPQITDFAFHPMQR